MSFIESHQSTSNCLFHLDFFLLAILAVFYRFVWTNREYFLSCTAHQLLLILSHWLYLQHWFNIMIMFHCLVLKATIVIVEILIWRMQLWQLNYAISSYRVYRRPSINQVLATYRRIVVYICTINPVIGKGFTILLALTAPATGLFLNSIFFKKISSHYRLLLSLNCIYLFIFIFGMHFVFAKRNSQLHNLSKQILVIPFHQRLARRSRISVNIFNETMYTKQTDGITYWKFGLISMLSFTQVCNTLIFSFLVTLFYISSSFCSSFKYLCTFIC